MNWFTASLGARLLAGAVFFVLLARLRYRLGPGTGWTLFSLLALTMGALFVFSPLAQLIALLFAVLATTWTELRLRKGRLDYQSAQVRIEGGGVKRGLTPPEVAILLGKPFKLTLSLVLFEMLRKGFLSQLQDSPLMVNLNKDMRTHGLGLNAQERGERRRKAAQAIPAAMQKYEEAFLEILESNPNVPVQDIDYGIAIQPLVRYVAGRVGGYDLEETRAYYRLIIERAPKEARSDGVLTFERQKVFDSNFGWVLLGEDFRSVLDTEDYSYVPVWLRDAKTGLSEKSFATWAEDVINSMEGAVAEEEVKLGLERETDLVTATLMNEIARATFYG